MRAPRWALALTAAGTAGAAAVVVGLPGSALADSAAPAVETRYNLAAIGDAFFFEVNGDEIPASTKNEAGSLTAAVETTNSGGTKSFAGAPYYGNTVQTLPGTINGVPNQFGAGALQIPFAQFPGFVEASSNGTPEKKEEGGYYRIKAAAQPTSGTAAASYGAPDQIPAPNQQQNANASTNASGSSVSAASSGSSAGFVMGPLEVGNSTAIASITQQVDKKAKIVSKTFGRFSVSGMDFGFDQNGFRYLGQGMSSKDAITQANSVLKNGNTQIDLAPAVRTVEGDQVTYQVGGLRITTTQMSPSGSGATYTISYILGRAKVSSSVASLGFSADSSATDSGAAASNVSDSATTSGTEDSTSDFAAINDVVSPELADEAAAAPATVAEVTDGEITDVVTDGAETGTDVTGTEEEALPKTLGFVPAAGETGDGTEWLYAMLLLAGVGVLGGHFLFGRFAAGGA